MKMTKKRDRRITLFVVLIMGFLTSSVSAATIEKEIIVSEKNPFNIVFTVEETGVIYAEVELKGAIEEIELILESHAGEVKREGGEMPLSLKYEVSKDDIAEGTEWKISVRSGLSERADGTLKITYPGDTTPPTIEITCSPENPTAEQQITFIATASSDRSGIDRIEILVNARKVEECFDSYSCTYVGGPYPDYAGTSVSYGANAYDKAGNRAWTGYKSVRISRTNNPPNMPRLSGLTSGYIGTSYSYSTSAEDPDGDDIKYTVDWGDDTTSETEFMYSGETASLSHDWAEPGEYHIRVKATDDKGASSGWSESLMVIARAAELIPPTAIISATPVEINEGESVSFSAEASGDQDGYIVSYYWDFGDGDTDTGINVEHTYYRSGHYTATLTVIDNDDLSHSDRIAITVNPLVTPNAPPTAYIDIYPNPAEEGEKVTFEGYGEDEDGEVVECRWTFPDGTVRSVSGSSDYFEDEDAQAGRYGFAVRDDGGAWSEEVEVELELETTVWTWILVAMLLAIAAGAIEEVRRRRGKNKNGSIFADSNPQNALIFLDEVYRGLSPATVPEVSVGAHHVKIRKFGYFDCKREAIVKANQTTHVHCDLTEIPGIKMKLSAEPIEIPADGKSKSTITIRIEDKDEIPIPVPEDVTVELITDKGTVESPVKIPAGRASVTATLTSTKAKGTATVEAKALFLKGSTTVEFSHST